MSNGSSDSTGASMAMQTGLGIPKNCVYGSYVIAKTSKSETNTYRRYYRCAYAATLKLSGDKHLFRWVEEDIVSEVDALTSVVKRLEAQVSTMSTYMEMQERLAMEKAEGEVAVKVEQAIVAANKRMIGTLIVVGVVVSVVSVGLMKWFG